MDWRGEHRSTADAYHSMAERELRGVSPSYEALSLGVAGDSELLARLDELPAASRQPNLLFASVRWLDGPVDAYGPFRAFVLDQWPEVASLLRTRRTQTNEAGRCAPLLPVLAGLDGPLALLEVGASAGLCLYPDRYAYRYRTPHSVVAVGDSPVILDCTVSGPAPLPAVPPQVVWRAGLDLHPLDVRSADDVRWLTALIWPEQRDRFAHLRAAVELVRADPPRLVTGDLTTDLAAVAASAPRDATLVVFHTAVLGYVDPTGRERFAAAVRDLAVQRGRVHWLSDELPGLVPGTESAVAGPARLVVALDGRPLARAAPHGERLEWLAV